MNTRRSPKWNELRDKFLRRNPACTVCGKKKNLVAHHKKPFHLFPELELDEDNLVTLCESSGMNCHITFGHLGDFKRYNVNVVKDITIWNNKIKKHV